MGDYMFSVDRIEFDKVILIDMNNKDKYIKDINLFPENIKEGDIVEFINNKYIIDEDKTREIEKRINDKFKSLIE